ncbi:MAG TPA: hypothetical protein VIL63_14710 [Terriglobales bacterium]
MKNSGLTYVLAVVSISPSAYAQAAKADSSKKNDYLAGTVPQQRHDEDSASNYVGGNPSDAPLRSEVYAYEISFRVNCATYVGRLDSAFDYIPAVFTLNRPVQVRLEKHLMYVDVPGEKEIRMGVVERPRGQSAPCSTGH